MAALIATGLAFSRIGLEAGPLSQWLHAGPAKAPLPVVLVEVVSALVVEIAAPMKV